MHYLSALKKDPFLIVVIGFSLFILLVSLKVTLFRYANYEFGKFDLGNMSQMVYNSSRGNFMEVTDYFGGNMPRWGMSHVDPFLLIFVPFYAFFPDARVLIVGQLVLVIFSSVLLYFIGLTVINSKAVSALVAISYLLYPALGYLLAWTGFHGVTAVIPFFLLAFLSYEQMYKNQRFTLRGLSIFCISLFLTMMGKEELSLVLAFYGLFIYFMRKDKRIGGLLFIFGLIWFSIAFFVLIPSAAKYRIDSYQTFVRSVGIELDPERDVLKPNYFLSRYDRFGDSYSEVLLSIATNPKLVGEVFFSGDKKENFTMTFNPVLYLPFIYLPTFLISVPEFVINYLTTSGGIGTSEIYNHRISMIIPILFISVFFSIKLLQDFLRLFLKRSQKFVFIAGLIVAFALLFANYYYSRKYQNPIVLWFVQSIERRFAMIPLAFAASLEKPQDSEKMVFDEGSKIRLKMLEMKDTKCLDDVVSLVPPEVSVSAPDYLGAHFSTRRINALFPSNFNTSDYIVVDLFSKKVSTILGVNESLVSRVVGEVLKNPNYELIFSCSNVFVFKKSEENKQNQLLPLQNQFTYNEKFNYDIGQSLKLVDFEIPKALERSKEFNLKYVYKKEGMGGLNGYVIYTTFKADSGEGSYQIANLPSFGIIPAATWEEGTYYLEENNFVLPEKLFPGRYKVFVGITNSIKSYNIYLTEVFVK
ncbi:MAG: DUF2079 domain-containing protein [Patescibacteria group bacterium]